MPCRPIVPPTEFPAFPPQFTPDTLTFQAALAEHNWNRTRAGLPVVTFLELDRAERHLVLARAQELKTGDAAQWTFTPAAPVLCPPDPPSWWVRLLDRIDRLVDRLFPPPQDPVL